MDSFKKVFLAGVGALRLTKEKATKVVEELISQGQVKEKEGRKLVDEMLKKADSTRKEVEQNVKGHIDLALSKVNSATQVQLCKMEKRIHDLEKNLASKSNSTTVSKKTAAKKTTKKKAATKKTTEKTKK